MEYSGANMPLFEEDIARLIPSPLLSVLGPLLRLPNGNLPRCTPDILSVGRLWRPAATVIIDCPPYYRFNRPSSIKKFSSYAFVCMYVCSAWPLMGGQQSDE